MQQDVQWQKFVNGFLKSKCRYMSTIYNIYIYTYIHLYTIYRYILYIYIYTYIFCFLEHSRFAHRFSSPSDGRPNVLNLGLFFFRFFWLGRTFGLGIWGHPWENGVFIVTLWLVVSTHLKNMLVKLGIFPNFRGENKNAKLTYPLVN